MKANDMPTTPPECQPLADNVARLKKKKADLQAELPGAAGPAKWDLLRAIASVSRQIADADDKLTRCVDAHSPPAPAQKSPQEQALIDFERSTQPGAWPRIAKQELIKDIRQKLANPYSVNQGATPLCGPAAIVFALLSRSPVAYVRICRELYETGQFETATQTARPSATLRASPAKNGISVADWMLMATLRDVENLLFPVESTSGPIVMGITSPWEMKGWATELLGYGVAEFTSTFFYGEFDGMREANQSRDIGGVAFLLIHSAMLGNPEPFVGYPDHWVMFQGALKIDEGVWWIHDSGHIFFDCYSWGALCHVDLGEGDFERYMFGVVNAK
jgi:hypothetical protein